MAHFDTQLLVERLQQNGMTSEQAEGVMKVLAEAVDESVRNMEAGLVSKSEQEKQRYTQNVDFAQLKSELQLHEKNDLTLMKVRGAAEPQPRLHWELVWGGGGLAWGPKRVEVRLRSRSCPLKDA